MEIIIPKSKDVPYLIINLIDDVGLDNIVAKTNKIVKEKKYGYWFNTFKMVVENFFFCVPKCQLIPQNEEYDVSYDNINRIIHQYGFHNLPYFKNLEKFIFKAYSNTNSLNNKNVMPTKILLNRFKYMMQPKLLTIRPIESYKNSYITPLMQDTFIKVKIIDDLPSIKQSRFQFDFFDIKMPANQKNIDIEIDSRIKKLIHKKTMDEDVLCR